MFYKEPYFGSGPVWLERLALRPPFPGKVKKCVAKASVVASSASARPLEFAAQDPPALHTVHSA